MSRISSILRKAELVKRYKFPESFLIGKEKQIFDGIIEARPGIKVTVVYIRGEVLRYEVFETEEGAFVKECDFVKALHNFADSRGEKIDYKSFDEKHYGLLNAW